MTPSTDGILNVLFYIIRYNCILYSCTGTCVMCMFVYGYLLSAC